MSDFEEALGIDPEDDEDIEDAEYVEAEFVAVEDAPTQTVIPVEEDELDEVKRNVDTAISHVGKAIERLSDVCEQVATAEHFSSLASLTNSYMNANKLKVELADRKEKKKNHQPLSPGYGENPGGVTNILLTSADLLRIAKQARKDGDS